MKALPELLPMIQTHLLDLLSLGLTRKPYRDNLSTAASHSLTQAIQLGESYAAACSLLNQAIQLGERRDCRVPSPKTGHSTR